MRCKNCKHKISQVLGQWTHIKYIGRRYKPIGTKCYCGCIRPEPQTFPLSKDRGFKEED